MTTDPTLPSAPLPDLDALTADIKRAHDELCDIAEGKRRWTMSIPAKEATDSDLVISRGLTAGEKALSALIATRAELDELKADAGEKYTQRLVEETTLRSLDFRNGRASMDMGVAREIAAAMVAAARTMLGDAPNYTETKVELDVKVAESPELYTFVVQRHAPGALTPHEARQKAEAELARVTERRDSLLAWARTNLGNSLIHKRIRECYGLPVDALTMASPEVHALAAPAAEPKLAETVAPAREELEQAWAQLKSARSLIGCLYAEGVEQWAGHAAAVETWRRFEAETDAAPAAAPKPDEDAEEAPCKTCGKPWRNRRHQCAVAGTGQQDTDRCGNCNGRGWAYEDFGHGPVPAGKCHPCNGTGKPAAVPAAADTTCGHTYIGDEGEFTCTLYAPHDGRHWNALAEFGWAGGTK